MLPSSGEILKALHNTEEAGTFFTGDIETCHSRKSIGVINKMTDG